MTHHHPHVLPDKLPVPRQHLQEVCGKAITKAPHDLHLETALTAPPQPPPLRTPLSIETAHLKTFVLETVALYIRNLRNPNLIPGKGLLSKVYALGIFPIVFGILVVCQWIISAVVLWSTRTRMGKYLYGVFLKNEIMLFDPTDTIDPHGTDEALAQLASTQPKSEPSFNYHIAGFLLILSTLTYERDDAKVEQAINMMRDITSEEQFKKVEEMLEQSERTINDKARQFQMRFRGISELKTVGGPFAGLFYSDESIVLVFKGTSVLAFNEYVVDAFIQRVQAKEFLYGEVHKGFYESIFPDPEPLGHYESMTYDTSNPFATIMEVIFETARMIKSKSGKPVNLWVTGHSLGGALASLTMARLQKPMTDSDPLIQEYDPRKDKCGARPLAGTVLEEMLARYSSDPELIVLRDCYSFASPKVGDSSFAREFNTNQLQYLHQSRFKPVYYRVIVDKDIIPMMPPGLRNDPNTALGRMFPCTKCPNGVKAKAKDANGYGTAKKGGDSEPHFHSLLDYQHVGQLVRLANKRVKPTAVPSDHQTDLCWNVLRGDHETKDLLRQVEQVRLQEQGLEQQQQQQQGKGKAAFDAKLAIQEMTDGEALHIINQEDRLRVPCDAENFLLTFPNVISHSPSTYQRNLVRARFYFQSFPCADVMEALLDTEELPKEGHGQ
ncbi:hypothetical protein BGW38_003216, partial [Lunasporangiospora selenospora]